jgi:hypothetical protein
MLYPVINHFSCKQQHQRPTKRGFLKQPTNTFTMTEIGAAAQYKLVFVYFYFVRARRAYLFLGYHRMADMLLRMYTH